MFASGNARYPNDVLVKGLPMDINESKLKEKFRSYGAILKVTIPAPKEHSQYRITFITFEDREAALQKFNAVDNFSSKDRRLRIT
jgi:RNA recognition motif-containing protein